MKNNAERQDLVASLKLKTRWKNFYQNLGLDGLVGTLDSGDVFVDVTKLRKDFEIILLSSFVDVTKLRKDFEIILLSPVETILLPPVEVQKQYLADLKYACERPINGYDPREIWLSPDTVGPNFPENISFKDRPENIPYILCLKNSQEPPCETREIPNDKVKSASELKKILKEEKKTGLTLFEYLVFRQNFISQRIAKRSNNPFPDTMYITWLLDSSLPDGRILVAGAHTDGILKVWAWPGNYKEHNCQGARWGFVVPLI